MVTFTIITIALCLVLAVIAAILFVFGDLVIGLLPFGIIILTIILIKKITKTKKKEDTK